jgi:hypothetical protein
MIIRTTSKQPTGGATGKKDQPESITYTDKFGKEVDDADFYQLPHIPSAFSWLRIIATSSIGSFNSFGGRGFPSRAPSVPAE